MPTFEFMVLDTRGKGDHTQVEAIATGQLAAIPALASRLAHAEHELAGLEGSANTDETAAVAAVKIVEFLPRAAERFRAFVANLGASLGRYVGRARAELNSLIGSTAVLQPAQDGRHLVAEMKLGPGILLAALWPRHSKNMPFLMDRDKYNDGSGGRIR